ncbi:hypothetical protein BDN67DRAFT_974666 [Paxillus ammoniavirescens]|nr:hypothetical protein BDN67DRAFT_974666 [Paxillus ammoniavirescens]
MRCLKREHSIQSFPCSHRREGSDYTNWKTGPDLHSTAIQGPGRLSPSLREELALMVCLLIGRLLPKSMLLLSTTIWLSAREL